MITVFSAPNYCGKFDNLGAMLIIEENMKCHIKQIKSSELLREKKKRNSTPSSKMRFLTPLGEKKRSSLNYPSSPLK